MSNTSNTSKDDEHKEFIKNYLIKSNNRIELPEISPDEYYLSNRAGFKSMILDEFKNYILKNKSDDKDLDKNIISLFPHQKFIRDYLNPKSPYRGLLIYHGLGVGKTCASIAAAELFLNKTYILKSKKKSIDKLYKDFDDNDKKVVVMLPKSLRANYINEIIKCGHEYYSTQQHWKHLSYNNLKKLKKDLPLVDDKFFEKNDGLWYSMDDKKSNFDDLNENEKQSIMNQLDFMVQKKYFIINYNGQTNKIIYGFENKKTGKFENGWYQDLKDTTSKYTDTYKNPDNPFNNKIVIIDEVHNFISYVLNGSRIMGSIYDMILKAEKCKILCLSGTPIINQPYEISLLLNMIKGIQRTFHLETKENFDEQQIENIKNILDKDLYIDNYKYNAIYKRLEINLLPLGFKRLKDSFKIRYSKDGDKISQKDIIDSLIKYINEQLNIKFFYNKKNKFPDNVEYRYLPNNIEEFKNLFIDEENFRMKNKYLFSKRILGSVSYFEYTNSKLFPDIRKNEIIKVDMSEVQLKKYIDVRRDEIRKEKRSGRNQNSDSIQVYKAFSRAICNFAFPDEIDRPYPSKLKLMLKHLSSQNSDESQQKNIDTVQKEDDKSETKANKEEKSTYLKNIDNNSKYEVIIQEVLTKLEEQQDILLKKELQLYSPKFKAILDNINKSEGNTLVYSQFRTVEGIGILKLILKANGYAEFKLKKVNNNFVLDIKEEDYNKPKFCEFSGDNEATPILLNIFNNKFNNLSKEIKDELYNLFSSNKNIRNDNTEEITLSARKKIGNIRGELLKVMMITQSGSEGISLANVRQINIVEPYWNKIRLDQVTGRGARTGSHLELPEKDRNLDVFTYLSVFSEEHLKEDKIQRLDKGKTTDETIMNLALDKAKINNQLLDLLKSSAVDCSLHKKNHPDISCFTYPDNYEADRLVLKTDIKQEDIDILAFEKQEKIERNLQIVEILKKKYLILKDINKFDKEDETGQLFDYEEFEQFGNYKFIGLLLKNKDDKFILRLVKN